MVPCFLFMLSKVHQVATVGTSPLWTLDFVLSSQSSQNIFRSKIIKMASCEDGLISFWKLFAEIYPTSLYEKAQLDDVIIQLVTLGILYSCTKISQKKKNTYEFLEPIPSMYINVWYICTFGRFFNCYGKRR